MNPNHIQIRGPLVQASNPAGIDATVYDAAAVPVGESTTLMRLDTSTNAMDVTLPEPSIGRAVRFVGADFGNLATLLPHDGEPVAGGASTTLVGSDDGTKTFWHVEYIDDTDGWTVLFAV